MFEESMNTQGNRFEITRNDKQNSSQNKLMSYFQHSGFLAQQEELGMFIKNMPIIKIQEISSLNKLIDILIRQNEALGGKCQHNVITVKQMFAKHEELLRKIRELQNKLVDKEREMESIGLAQQKITSFQEQILSYQQKVSSLEHQIVNLKSEVKEREQTITTLTDMSEELGSQNKICLSSLKQMAEVVRLIGERNFKKCSEKIKECSRSRVHHWDWVDFDSLEKFIKDEKKRAKYIPKVKETVQLFCNRFLKISEFMPAHMMKGQFNRQVSNLMELLDDLLFMKKRMSTSGSQSRISVTEVDCNFFEGVLEKVFREKEMMNSAEQEIGVELSKVREELAESKEYYEQYILKAKMEFEQFMRSKDEELTEKSQLIESYEQQKEKNRIEMKELRSKIEEVEECIKIERMSSQVKNDEISSLEQKLQHSKSQNQMKESQIRTQWEDNIKTYELKIAQKQQLFEEEQRQKKQIRTEFQSERSDLKLTISSLEQRIKELSSSNRQLSEEIQNMQSSLQKMKKKTNDEASDWEKLLQEKQNNIEELSRKKEKDHQEIKKIKAEQEQNQKEKSLQASYIKELENKNKDLLNKLKTADAKKIEQKTIKKEMDITKKTILEEKKHSRQMEQTLGAQREQSQKQKEEIQRLKGIIRQMKKELEQLYHQLNGLKVIQNDREKLMIEMQKSDRIREELLKNYDLQRGQMLRLQQENKGLSLEVKHYRNALSRIEALRC